MYNIFNPKLPHKRNWRLGWLFLKPISGLIYDQGNFSLRLCYQHPVVRLPVRQQIFFQNVVQACMYQEFCVSTFALLGSLGLVLVDLTHSLQDYSRLPWQHGPIWLIITCSTALTKVEHKSELKFTNDTTYLTLTCKLWSVYCEDFRNNWTLYNSTAWYFNSMTATCFIVFLVHFLSLVTNVTCLPAWFETVDVCLILHNLHFLHFNCIQYVGDSLTAGSTEVCNEHH